MVEGGSILHADHPRKWVIFARRFTLGRLLRTQDSLWFITDPKTREGRTRQLNKGEERHGLSRWVFFGNQGEFDTGDYVEIMNKASCLSLVSNAILY